MSDAYFGALVLAAFCVAPWSHFSVAGRKRAGKEPSWPS
jgi:hypothetical protein